MTGVDRRSPAGSNYGDGVPDSKPNDPSRGAEMERDAMPPGGDFSRPPPGSAGAEEPDTPLPAPAPAR